MFFKSLNYLLYQFASRFQNICFGRNIAIICYPPRKVTTLQVVRPKYGSNATQPVKFLDMTGHSTTLALHYGILIIKRKRKRHFNIISFYSSHRLCPSRQSACCFGSIVPLLDGNSKSINNKSIAVSTFYDHCTFDD